LALKSLNIPSAQSHATKVLHHLLENFFVDAASVANQRQDSSLVTSDEVQFSVMMALGHLSTLVLMVEKLLREVIDTLVTKLSEVDEK